MICLIFNDIRMINSLRIQSTQEFGTNLGKTWTEEVFLRPELGYTLLVLVSTWDIVVQAEETPEVMKLEDQYLEIPKIF